ALVFNDRSYSYGDLDARARRCAGWLQRLGVEPGDRIALVTADKPRFLVAHLGTLWAGAISLPLNPRFTREELRFFLQDSGARVVVASADLAALFESLRDELPER